MLCIWLVCSHHMWTPCWYPHCDWIGNEFCHPFGRDIVLLLTLNLYWIKVIWHSIIATDISYYFNMMFLIDMKPTNYGYIESVERLRYRKYVNNKQVCGIVSFCLSVYCIFLGFVYIKWLASVICLKHNLEQRPFLLFRLKVN